MMKIINAFPGVGESMTEEETKNFMANNDNNLLVRVGIIDDKREPNVIPLAYTFWKPDGLSYDISYRDRYYYNIIN